MKTKEYTYYIKNIETRVYYDDADGSFHCESAFVNLKNPDLTQALLDAEQYYLDYFNKITNIKDGYYTTEIDISNVPNDIQIFLGRQEPLNKATFNVDYINLLSDAKTSPYGALIESQRHSSAIILEYSEDWLLNIYKELEKLSSLSSNFTYALTYKFGKEDINDRDWDIVLNVIKTLKNRYPSNNFVICNYFK